MPSSSLTFTSWCEARPPCSACCLFTPIQGIHLRGHSSNKFTQQPLLSGDLALPSPLACSVCLCLSLHLPLTLLFLCIFSCLCSHLFLPPSRRPSARARVAFFLLSLLRNDEQHFGFNIAAIAWHHGKLHMVLEILKQGLLGYFKQALKLMPFVDLVLQCEDTSAPVVDSCNGAAYVGWKYRKVNLLQRCFLSPSKLLTIDYSVRFQKKVVFLWWCTQFFFPKRHMNVSTHMLRALTDTRTRVHTQTPNLVFLLSRRSMNKTGVQRLCEKQWETWGVLADLSAAVAVYSCHNLRVWTYRISSLLDAVCSENAHSFANLTVQTGTRSFRRPCAKGSGAGGAIPSAQWALKLRG